MADQKGLCGQCNEELGDNPINVKGVLYCSKTCAFEAAQKPNICGEARSLESATRSQISLDKDQPGRGKG